MSKFSFVRAVEGVSVCTLLASSQVSDHSCMDTGWRNPSGSETKDTWLLSGVTLARVSLCPCTGSLRPVPTEPREEGQGMHATQPRRSTLRSGNSSPRMGCKQSAQSLCPEGRRSFDDTGQKVNLPFTPGGRCYLFFQSLEKTGHKKRCRASVQKLWKNARDPHKTVSQ